VLDTTRKFNWKRVCLSCDRVILSINKHTTTNSIKTFIFSAAMSVPIIVTIKRYNRNKMKLEVTHWNYFMIWFQVTIKKKFQLKFTKLKFKILFVISDYRSMPHLNTHVIPNSLQQAATRFLQFLVLSPFSSTISHCECCFTELQCSEIQFSYFYNLPPHLISNRLIGGA
jgi:hypothetical protein